MAGRGPPPDPMSGRSQKRGLTNLALVPKPKRKPKPGTWLSKPARLEWWRAARLLEEIGTLSAADATLLDAYAALYVDLATATSPSIRMRASAEMRRCAEALGLTLAARLKTAAKKRKPEGAGRFFERTDVA